MLLVNENLYRSARPKDLQPLKDLGFTILISLESGMYEMVSDTKREHQFCPDFGIKEYDLHSSIITAPEEWRVNKFLEIVAKGEKTLVQCLSGVDRTGFMCAVYRMRVQGWSFDRAHLEWLNLGRHFVYAEWTNDLKKWQNK